MILRKLVTSNWVHVSLGLVSGDGGRAKKGIFFWSRKIMCEEPCQELLKSCVLFWGGLEGCNEKKWGGNRKKSFYSEMWGPCLRRACENPVGLSMQSFRNCWIHLVNIWWMLDWILSQNCRNTLPLHTVDQIASSAKNGRLLWLEGMKCVKIPTHCKAEHLIA